MDTVLCDELLQEILGRLPPSAAASISLVSKRWLSLLRSATSSLRVRVPPPASSSTAAGVSLSSILAHYPFLADLTVSAAAADGSYTPPASGDALVFLVSAAPCAARLARLRLVPDSPLSSAALLSCAPSFPRLAHLQVGFLSHPVSLRWLAALPSLKSLSLMFSFPKSGDQLCEVDHVDVEDDDGDDRVIPALPLEKLSLTGIRAANLGFSWLWRRCGNLRWLQLRACDGTGDGDSSEGGSFVHCLHDGLLGLELRTCRTIADRVLLRAADRCHGLASLLLYDGGSRDALRYFIHRRGAFLRTIDLRLPLDLHNDHLLAIAAAEDDSYKHGGGHNLVALRLQSCCLVTGEGLRSLVKAPAGAAIEELALVNCDVVEREPGLLTFLSQSMHRLRILDLSHNEMITDKVAGAMLASCKNLVEIRLRGCRGLTGAFVTSLLKYCGRKMEVVDLDRCPGIGADAVENLALNAPRLSHLLVEESKVTEAARTWLSKRAVRIESIDLLCNPSAEH